MDTNDKLQEPLAEAAGETTSRRTFVKTGATLTGGLLLSGVYAKPRIQSVDLAVLPNPSSGGSSGDPGSSGGNRNQPKKPKKPKKDK